MSNRKFVEAVARAIYASTGIGDVGVRELHGGVDYSINEDVNDPSDYLLVVSGMQIEILLDQYVTEEGGDRESGAAYRYAQLAQAEAIELELLGKSWVGPVIESGEIYREVERMHDEVDGRMTGFESLKLRQGN